MPRPKGSKLSKEHKEKLRESALKHYHERKQARDENGEFKKTELEKNVGENVKPNGKNDAGENGPSENNIQGPENDNRESGRGNPETLEIEKGEMMQMEIPPKETETKPEIFTCGSCKNEITMGVKFCPHCGCQLNWSVAE